MKKEKTNRMEFSGRELKVRRGIDWPIWYWICGIAIMGVLIIYEVSHERKVEMLTIDSAILCMIIADMAEARFCSRKGMYISILAVVGMAVCIVCTGYFMTKNDGIAMRIVLIAAWSFIVVREVYNLVLLIKSGNFEKRKRFCALGKSNEESGQW